MPLPMTENVLADEQHAYSTIEAALPSATADGPNGLPFRSYRVPACLPMSLQASSVDSFCALRAGNPMIFENNWEAAGKTLQLLHRKLPNATMGICDMRVGLSC